MKKIFLLFVIMFPGIALAAAPSTSCPAGFVAIKEDAMIISSGICDYASGYTSTGVAYSCLKSDPTLVNGSCIMYAEGGPWTDSTGTYEFEGPCMLE